MASPFANVTFQESSSLFFQDIDETRARINKFIRIQLRIATLVSCRSLPPPNHVQVKKSKTNHKHMQNVGTLMVTAKKPFRVRFNVPVTK
jgi:hypothetical protein